MVKQVGQGGQPDRLPKVLLNTGGASWPLAGGVLPAAASGFAADGGVSDFPGAVMGLPQWLQNACPGSSAGAPQAGQCSTGFAAGRGLPQAAQNRASAPFSMPQLHRQPAAALLTGAAPAAGGA